MGAPAPGLTSIVIPTYNHARQLPEALEAALAQTAPVEIIVVDDGSTDETQAGLDAFRRVLPGSARLDVIRVEHGGPSAARNVGLEHAIGDFVMFLDADDLIAPTKVERQVAELARTPAAGWCLCDVTIVDEVKGRTITASEQYGYGSIRLDGWIDKALARANFVPIMAPLIRRQVVEAIRFDDRTVPEDWYFWQRVAAVARVCYLPEVLATYRHGRTGRSRQPKASRAVVPNTVGPLRLNLGCGTPGTRSWHPIDGLVNLDKSLGWTFEQGLGDFADGSVAGVTISHALMYLDAGAWRPFLGEVARVLGDGGIVRITEDDCDNPASARLGGWQGSQPAVTLTSPAFVAAQLARAGLEVLHVDEATTWYRDRSLCQAQHGRPPDVFFIEGHKPARVFLAPHNDDETLFGAFTILKYRPRVVVCYPSVRDYGAPELRARETREACDILGACAVEQWDGAALGVKLRALEAERRPAVVWAPHPRASHPEHRALGGLARDVFGDRVRYYHTYDEAGKVRAGAEVEYETEWIETKLRALLRYPSQLAHPRASAFFAWDLTEYTEP